MIRVIDGIRYLPKKRNVFIDENEVYNDIFKDIVKTIKNKLSKIPTRGKSATVKISGQSGSSNSSLNINIDCDDDELLKTIEAALNE